MSEEDNKEAGINYNRSSFQSGSFMTRNHSSSGNDQDFENFKSVKDVRNFNLSEIGDGTNLRLSGHDNQKLRMGSTT